MLSAVRSYWMMTQGNDFQSTTWFYRQSWSHCSVAINQPFAYFFLYYCNIPFTVDDISKTMQQIEVSDIDPPPLIRENSGFSFLLPRAEWFPVVAFSFQSSSLPTALLHDLPAAKPMPTFIFHLLDSYLYMFHFPRLVFAFSVWVDSFSPLSCCHFVLYSVGYLISRNYSSSAKTLSNK